MSIDSKPLSEYKIGDSISPYKKLVAKFDIYVVEYDDGKLSPRMDIQRDSKHLTHDEIIKVLEDQLKVQLKLKKRYDYDHKCVVRKLVRTNFRRTAKEYFALYRSRKPMVTRLDRCLIGYIQSDPKCKQNYLFASMDDDIRYWLASDIAETKFQHNADNLLQLAKLHAGKNLRSFITDDLPVSLHKENST